MRNSLARGILALILLSGAAGFAQQQSSEDTVSVPKNLLTKEQLAQVASADLQKRIDTYGKFVGVGHEVGTAVNESLTALTTQAEGFSRTSLGKWTMFVVVYKVIGGPLLGAVVGIGLWLTLFPFWLWSYRKFLPRKYLVKEILDEKGKVTARNYDITKADDDALGVHILVGVAVTLLSVAIVFMSQ